MEIELRGIGVSPGIAIGPALPFGVQSLEVPKYRVEDRVAELARFEQALTEVREQLALLHEYTEKKLGEDHAGIIQAHMLLLDDVTLIQEIEERVESEGLNAEYLVDEFLKRNVKLIQDAPDPRMRERAKDLLDVGKHLLAKLADTELDTLENLKTPCVVISRDLSPSETANIDTEKALGIAIDVSGRTSHTAILARALEIPAVVGLQTISAYAHSGDLIIVDGTSGSVIIRPTQETLKTFIVKRERQIVERRALLKVEESIEGSTTLDGRSVPCFANIELPVEIPHSLSVKAQGVGLYRTEYLFLDRNTLPTEEEQFEAYTHLANSFKSCPVILRTLDIGGDKFASHLTLADEMNPQLGWRAIRFCLERPDVFKAQLRAMLRASVVGNIRIMFPMISGVDELRKVKVIFGEVCADLERRSVPFDKDVKLGAMIEVPSAVVVADKLAEETDFFSIGTNDLIQYSLAVDRVNEKIAHMYEPAHPAVLRMIKQTADAARTRHIPCSLCGEMAGDPLFTELLIGLGVDSLSMSAVALPEIRAEVSMAKLSSARKLAKRVLEMSSASKIRTLLEGRAKKKGTLEQYLSKSELDAAGTEKQQE